MRCPATHISSSGHPNVGVVQPQVFVATSAISTRCPIAVERFITPSSRLATGEDHAHRQAAPT
jgi:hypothetical protein